MADSYLALVDDGAPRHHFRQTPSLELVHWPGLYDAPGVARPRLALLVVGVEFLDDADIAFIELVLHPPGHAHHDGLLHFRAGDHADQLLAAPPLACRRALRFRAHDAALNSRCRSSVFTRARSRRAKRSRGTASAWPVVSWKRSRKTCSASSRSRLSSSAVSRSRSFSILRAITDSPRG